MANTVASRFAVLPDDVDDDYSSRKKKVQVKKPDTSKATPAVSNKVAQKKKKTNKENTQAQVPNGKVKAKSGASKKKKEPSPEDWEKWKQKDEQIVEGAYAEDLTQAILLSKLDYEEKKDIYDEQAKVVQPDKKPEQSKKNKKNQRVLSVEEFMNLGKAKPVEGSPTRSIPEKEPFKDDPTFFERIKDDVKKELVKDGKAPSKKAVREPFNEEALTLAQVRDQLDKKCLEVTELRVENTKLKEELLNVKTRNKKLCQILANGEMKDKAEVLVEVEKLERVREELSEEICSLHAQLEQERSKVRALTSGDSKTKDKNKKRTTSSGDQ